MASSGPRAAEITASAERDRRTERERRRPERSGEHGGQALDPPQHTGETQRKHSSTAKQRKLIWTEQLLLHRQVKIIITIK